MKQKEQPTRFSVPHLISHLIKKKSNDQRERSTPHGPKHETRHIAMRKTKPRRFSKNKAVEKRSTTEEVQKQK
jgi:hypothetical protein